MAFSISTANDKQLLNWDTFVEASVNGTLFHTRRFLSYHGSRFSSQEYFLVIKKGDDVVGQIAVAIRNQNNVLTAMSPYGASYGGIILKRLPSYAESTGIVNELINWLKKNEVEQCRLTAPLDICAEASFDILKFVFLENGFKSINRDISSVVKLNKPTNALLSSKTRNVIKTAIQRGVKVKSDAPLHEFWQLMEMTYSRHGVNPTHSKEELDRLMHLFPVNIRTHTAEYDGVPIAGLCEFTINKRVESAFYFCRNPEFDRLQGLSVLIQSRLEEAVKQGFEYYDFGTSSVNMIGRPNIFSFKEGFGAIGIFRETLELNLTEKKEVA